MEKSEEGQVTSRARGGSSTTLTVLLPCRCWDSVLRSRGYVRLGNYDVLDRYTLSKQRFLQFMIYWPWRQLPVFFTSIGAAISVR